jgi:MerR family mercuric resistance operon transcriptional regulator
MLFSLHLFARVLLYIPYLSTESRGNVVAPELTIGKLADAAGVNIETIRYYQRRGLLDEPPKPLGGHRRYAPEQAKRVRFIKRAQALGFTLDEVGALLTLDTACVCGESRALAMRKLGLIEQKMADLAAMRQALDGLIQQCDAGDAHAACPIIEVLARD